MQPTPAKPPKKRRRWLIVAFVFVLVSLVTWWYWPRGDARFVGKWALAYRGEESRGMWWKLSANGSAKWYRAIPPKLFTTSWHVRGNQLVVGKPWGELGFSPIVKRAVYYFEVCTGIAILTDDEFPSEIISVGANEIELKGWGPDNPLILTRIPE